MPELRKDPIVGRWVIIATERAKRPHDFGAPRAEPRRGALPVLPRATRTRRRPRSSPTAPPTGRARAPTRPAGGCASSPTSSPRCRSRATSTRGRRHLRPDERRRRPRGHRRDARPRPALRRPQPEDNIARRPRGPTATAWSTCTRDPPLAATCMLFKNHGAAGGRDRSSTRTRSSSRCRSCRNVVWEEMTGARSYYAAQGALRLLRHRRARSSSERRAPGLRERRLRGRRALRAGSRSRRGSCRARTAHAFENSLERGARALGERAQASRCAS